MRFAYAVGALWAMSLARAAPESSPQIISVSDPLPYPAPSAPNETAVYPLGDSRCEKAIRALMDMTSICLNSYTADGDNQHWCQADDGCRKVLSGLAQEVHAPCYTNHGMAPTIANVFDQITYATSVACPSDDDDSCDVQSELVLTMVDFPANRSLMCSPCVKKSFGRMSLLNRSDHNEVYGKKQCNQVEGQYCNLPGYSTAEDVCSPCWQRHYAKMRVANIRHGLEDRLDRVIRGCYDNGHGDSCLNQTMKLLKTAYNVDFDESGSVETLGDFKACLGSDPCNKPECKTLLESVIQDAGCCASALPVVLLKVLHLFPCLEPMIDSTVGLNTACFEPFSYFVDITVATTDSVENVCQAVQEDLATTLAMLPELITCAKSDFPDSNTDNLTVRAVVTRYRTIGMPASVPFDPDLLQYPVVRVLTSAVL